MRDHRGGEQVLVDALHRRVVHHVGRAQAGAVHEAGIVADHLRVARQRSQRVHELGARAAVPVGHEDRRAGCAPTTARATTSSDREHARRADRIAASSASGGTIAARWLRYSAGSSTSTSAVTTAHAAITVDVARDAACGSRPRLERAPARRDDRGDEREHERADHEQVAAAQRREELAELAELRVPGPGAAVVRDRLIPHVAEAPRQRGREPQHDRGADRGREMVEPAARPQPPADRDRGREDQRLHRERGAHHARR